MCTMPRPVDTSIRCGDKVRSYDFPDDYRPDARGCYIEGIVLESREYPELHLDGPRYKIVVTAHYWMGEKIKCEQRVLYPPVNGTPKSTGGVCNGVEKLEAFTQALTQ